MRRNPDDPFDDIFREIERLMEEMMGVEDADVTASMGGGNDTHVDVHEYDDTIRLVADLPGVTKDDIDLKCDGRTLSITASNAERRYDERVRLPAAVNEGSASATYNNGVLEVSFERVDDSADIDVS